VERRSDRGAAKEEEVSVRKPRKKVKKVKKEKTDREEIFEALQKLGHEPSYFELDGRPQSLHSLSRCDADLIFNLTESFDGDDTKEMNVVAYIDLLGLRYTGAGPTCHFSCPGQGDRQEDLRISRHQDSVLCHSLSRAH
jgi:D-alanine-D-alanine ligase-like ATP-grasp enzyme